MAKLSRQAQMAKDVLDKRNLYSSTQDWLESLLALFHAEETMQDDSLDLVEQELRGGYGWEYTKIQDEYNEHISFWRRLAQRFPEKPKLKGILADTLLLAGRKDEALDLSLEAFRLDPILVYKFGGELNDFYKEKGGEHWLDYQLVLVRAALESENEEYAREVYQRLLEEHRGDEAAMKKIYRIVGGKI